MMVDVPRLLALLERIEDEVTAIRESVARSDEELLAAPDPLPALKYRLVVAIEAAIDAAAHVIASQGLRSPEDFADTFGSLVEADWLAPDLGARLADAARFRNVLVHLYDDVDDMRVLEIARTRLGDLEAFTRAVAARVDAD